MLEKIYLFQVSESSIFRVLEYQNFRERKKAQEGFLPTHCPKSQESQTSTEVCTYFHFSVLLEILQLLSNQTNDKIIRIRIIWANMKSLLNTELELIKKIDIQKNIEEIDNII